MACEFIPATLSNYEVENYVNLTDTMSVLQERNSKKLASNPSAKVCPIQTPFFNNVRCISCPKETPLFNHTSKICVKCLRT
jgi:ribosomal protein S27E